MNWVTALLNPKAPAPQERPLPGATPRNSRAGARSVHATPAPSIAHAPVTVRHRIADQEESAEDKASRLGHSRRAARPSLWPLDADESAGASDAQAGAERAIHAQVNHGAVDFRVTGQGAVTFEELEEACAKQLPGVVLQRSTKWLQHTFDMWAHAGTCLYSIPIASVTPPEASRAADPGQQLPTTRRKKRGSAADLAAHHPRG